MKISLILQSKPSGEVATITPETTIADAVRSLAKHKIGALVVSRGGGEIAGILSERDIIRGLGTEGPESLHSPVSALMTTKVETCTGDDTAIGVLGRMTRGRFRHLPAVGPDGKMIGIVSIGDVVKARLEEMERENKAMAEMLSH